MHPGLVSGVLYAKTEKEGRMARFKLELKMKPATKVVVLASGAILCFTDPRAIPPPRCPSESECGHNGADATMREASVFSS